MKKVSLIFGLLLVLLAGISAQAQVTAKYKTNIPFDFNVGQKTYKAGDYEISLASPISNQTSFVLKEVKGESVQTVVFLPQVKDSNAKLSKLVFARYENQYFLSEVVTGDFAGKLPKAKIENELAKKQNEKATERETVTVVLGN